MKPEQLLLFSILLYCQSVTALASGSQHWSVGHGSGWWVTALVSRSRLWSVGHSTGQWVTALVIWSQHWSVGRSTGQWVTTLISGSQHWSVGHSTGQLVTTLVNGSQHWCSCWQLFIASDWNLWRVLQICQEDTCWSCWQLTLHAKYLKSHWHLMSIFWIHYLQMM